MTEVAQRKKTVHFDLEGAWFADLLRTRVKEGCWERALAMVLEGLDGITHELAQKLLTGRADLTGWASDKDGLGFDELPDTHTLAVQMDEVHQRLYGDVFRWQDDYWKPYAIVRGWNRDDMTHASQWGSGYQAVGFGGRDGRLSALRTLYYADEQGRDLAVYAKHPLPEHGTNVLCKKVRMPPMWFKMPSALLRPDDFVAELLQSGESWELRGADGTGRTDDEDLEQRQERIGTSRGEDLKEEPKKVPTVEDANMMAAEFLRRLNDTQSPTDINALGREFDSRFEEIRKTSRSLAVDEPLQQAEDIAHARRMSAYQSMVATQADEHGGWLELKVTKEDGTPFDGERAILRIPKNPFLLWSLKGYDFEAHGKEEPVWRNVCPSGMKMPNDDRHHTDWVVGAGLDPEKTYDIDDAGYDRRVQSCAFGLRGKVTGEWTSAQFVTLARGLQDRYYGEVVKPGPNESVPAGSIAVVPHAGPEYQLAMESACRPGKYGRPGALICDVGGKLAHLALVGRELRCTVLMVANASKRFRAGDSLSVNLLDGTLSWTLH